MPVKQITFSDMLNQCRQGEMKFRYRQVQDNENSILAMTLNKVKGFLSLITERVNQGTKQ